MFRLKRYQERKARKDRRELKRHLLVLFVIVTMPAAAVHIRGTPHGKLVLSALEGLAPSALEGLARSPLDAPPPPEKFVMRVVTSGLANPFQVIWGPDDYLWVTERTAGRVTRIRPSDGLKTTAIAISDVLAEGPGGVLGMALDPDLLKGTGNDYVYVAYTYDA